MSFEHINFSCYQIKRISMGRIFDFLCLGILSIDYGAAYALVSKALCHFNGTILNALRMCFAFAGALTYFLLLVLFKKDFYTTVKDSVKKGETPFISSMICGILNYGLPHSLISIAQMSIPSTLVVIVQPFTSLFQFFMANCCIPDEQFKCLNFMTQMLAIIGSMVTSITNFSNLDFNDSSSFTVLHYIFLIVALLSFAFGSIYVKKYLKNSNSELMCTYQLLGSAIYAVSFAMIQQKGINGFANSVSSSKVANLWYPAVLGICFTCLATFLAVHCINTLGATIQGFANYGQIIVGVIVGVLFLHEWDGYTSNDYLFALSGLVILILSMIFGVSTKLKEDKEETIREQALANQYDDIDPLIE